MAWAGHLTLRALEGQVAHIAALPGHRDMIGFMSPDRRKQLGEMLRSVLGRPVRVEVDASPVVQNPDAGDEAHAGVRSNGSVARNGSGVGGASRHMPTQAERAEIMDLPLVKQVMEVFDVTLVGVRTEAQVQQETVSPGEGDSVAGGDNDSLNDSNGADHV